MSCSVCGEPTGYGCLDGFVDLNPALHKRALQAGGLRYGVCLKKHDLICILF